MDSDSDSEHQEMLRKENNEVIERGNKVLADSVWHLYRRKTKREERKEAITTVLADGRGGGGGVRVRNNSNGSKKLPLTCRWSSGRKSVQSRSCENSPALAKKIKAQLENFLQIVK